ncbi:MAG: hypothetical protein AMXMBFR56_72920 [Polyangiaceae bacterium]
MISDQLRARMEALLAIADAPFAASLRMPLRVESRANIRQHWGDASKHSAKHRLAARMVCARLRPSLRRWVAASGGLVVRVVRVAPRALDSHDNLGAALKPVIDGVADALGLTTDADARVVFVPDAVRGGVREHAVELEFYPLSRGRFAP